MELCTPSFRATAPTRSFHRRDKGKLIIFNHQLPNKPKTLVCIADLHRRHVLLRFAQSAFRSVLQQEVPQPESQSSQAKGYCAVEHHCPFPGIHHFFSNANFLRSTISLARERASSARPCAYWGLPSPQEHGRDLKYRTFDVRSEKYIEIPPGVRGCRSYIFLHLNIAHPSVQK